MKIGKYKSDFSYSYTLGITLTIELLKKHPQDTQHIYFHSSYKESDGSKILLELIKINNISFSTNDKVFNLLSDKDNCYCIGVFNKYLNEIQLNQNHLVLVNPSNSGNLGTIIRSALGFGITNIAIIKPGVDIYDPKCIRASMGAIFSINWEYFNTFEDYIKKANNNTIYSFMLKGEKTLANTKFKTPFTLIFGNEATGLNDSFLKYNSVVISHSKDIDSLNLPIALSVACYEATKNTWNN